MSLQKLACNLDEVFELAEQIERNGAAFYRKAADIVETEPIRNFLLRLAEEEDEHERDFQALRKELVSKAESIAAYDVDDVVAHYLQALANSKIFNVAQEPEDLLEDEASLPNILNIAIGKEKDSIILYLGMMDAMENDNDKARVRRILWEEQKHLANLIETRMTGKQGV